MKCVYCGAAPHEGECAPAWWPREHPAGPADMTGWRLVGERSGVGWKRVQGRVVPYPWSVKDFERVT